MNRIERGDKDCRKCGGTGIEDIWVIDGWSARDCLCKDGWFCNNSYQWEPPHQLLSKTTSQEERMKCVMVDIEHISDVLPAIAGRTDFVVAERDGYTAVDYLYAESDTFSHPIRRECRGLKFGRDGRIIGRPFAKFFNIGEREETQPHLLDFNQPHLVMDKLDGSMIHPALVDGELVFMTRMGRSDQAKASEKLFLDERTRLAFRTLLNTGITPIFEYTGPKNRIILRYEAPALTLLAAREMITGRYIDRENLQILADDLEFPLVEEFSNEWSDVAEFVNFVRAIQGKEGFVVHFPGEAPERMHLKAKGDDYVLKHKSKEAIGLEKNVLALIVSNGLDDVLSLVPEEDRPSIEEYRDQVMVGFAKTIDRLDTIVASGANLDQKAFAVEHLAGAPSAIRSLAFSTRRSGDARAELLKFIERNVGTQSAVDNIRDLFGAEWKL